MIAVIVVALIVVAGLVGWVAGALYGFAEAQRRQAKAARHPSVDYVRRDP